MRRIALALAFLACASTPVPVRVSERDLASARAAARAAAPTPAPDAHFEIIELEVRERAVEIELHADTPGDGWRREDRAICTRCGEEMPWACSTHTSTYVESAFVGGGLSGDDAVKAIRFVRGSSDPDLARVSGISCVAAISERVIYLEYGAAIHHAGSASGLVVLQRNGDSFELDSIRPPPDWFEEGRLGILECDTTQFFTLPSC